MNKIEFHTIWVCVLKGLAHRHGQVLPTSSLAPGQNHDVYTSTTGHNHHHSMRPSLDVYTSPNGLGSKALAFGSSGRGSSPVRVKAFPTNDVHQACPILQTTEGATNGKIL